MVWAATGALSTAERSHPTSEVRGRRREDPMPKGRQPRGVTPCQRSGAAAKSTRLQWRRNGGEELPRVQVRGDGRKEQPQAPTPEARGGGREDQPHVQGAVTVRAQEGLEELPRATPRSGGVVERRYPVSEVRGGDERSYLTPLSQRPGAAGGRTYPMPACRRPGAAAGRSNPRPRPGAVPGGPTPCRGLEELSHVEGQEGQR